MKERWPEIKQRRMEDTRVCEVKGCKNPIQDAHHVFVHIIKRFKAWCDREENMQLVCEAHHADGTANSWKNENEYLEIQLERYDMISFLLDAPSEFQRTPDWKSLCRRIYDLVAATS